MMLNKNMHETRTPGHATNEKKENPNAIVPYDADK